VIISANYAPTLAETLPLTNFVAFDDLEHGNPAAVISVQAPTAEI
jgi:hypothetical protein